MTNQRVNLDIDRELWKQAGIKALEDGITKRELVEQALKNYINKKVENNMTEENNNFSMDDVWAAVRKSEEESVDVEPLKKPKSEIYQEVAAELEKQDEMQYVEYYIWLGELEKDRDLTPEEITEKVDTVGFELNYDAPVILLENAESSLFRIAYVYGDTTTEDVLNQLS